MIEIEVLGAPLAAELPSMAQIELMCNVAVACAGIEEGHMAIQLVDAETITALNERYRGKRAPTDVLSFPIDGADPCDGAPRELGDVVICPEHTADISEAIVHGVLHLIGLDHETDQGEMLAVQSELLRWTRPPSQ
jgi:probable rRNA maturation factor